MFFFNYSAIMDEIKFMPYHQINPYFNFILCQIIPTKPCKQLFFQLLCLLVQRGPCFLEEAKPMFSNHLVQLSTEIKSYHCTTWTPPFESYLQQMSFTFYAQSSKSRTLLALITLKYLKHYSKLIPNKTDQLTAIMKVSMFNYNNLWEQIKQRTKPFLVTIQVDEQKNITTRHIVKVIQLYI